jgi:hypothetical protein
VTTVTEMPIQIDRDSGESKGCCMPILMLALVGLFFFIVIGVLCLTAVIMESRLYRKAAAGVHVPEEAPIQEEAKSKALAAHA